MSLVVAFRIFSKYAIALYHNGRVFKRIHGESWEEVPGSMEFLPEPKDL